jgi:ABC-type uncharacterized transport system permease subunit
MLSGISTICFASSYAIALALEIVNLRLRFPWRRLVLMAMTAAGLLAHTLFLAYRAQQTSSAPLSSPAEWLLLAAWVLGLVYLAGLLYLPRAAIGLILLPLILGLIGASLAASHQPFAPARASRFWGDLHGSVLLMGAVTVCIGFAAGIMYLLQAYWLKHRWPPSDWLRLPSLEWLERVNTYSLAVSAFLIGLGFASGIILSKIIHRGQADYFLWTDPVVLSLAALLLYLVAAEIFRLVYPAARRGRKVAYLTLASFGFLVLALAAMLLADRIHGQLEQGATGHQEIYKGNTATASLSPR